MFANKQALINIITALSLGNNKSIAQSFTECLSKVGCFSATSLSSPQQVVNKTANYIAY